MKNSIVNKADEKTSIPITINSEHYHLHKGEMFFHNRVYTLASTATMSIVMETGAYESHYFFSVDADDAGFTYATYKNPAYDAESGSLMDILNYDVDSVKTSKNILRLNPTNIVTTSSILYRTGRKGTATNPAKSSAGSISFGNELILPPNTKWLLSITNLASANNYINIGLNWYEIEDREQI